VSCNSTPTILTLDVEMPHMDGVEFLRRLMAQRPMPVVMVSALTRKGARITVSALAAGALDVVAKPLFWRRRPPGDDP
jgi:two-component system chemotaxis response regulator CheB